MIDAKDLRIGNLIKWNDDGGANCFYKVHEIRPDSNFGAECISSEFAWFPDMWTISYTEAEGIPLTPEILEKCGFVQPQDEGSKCWVHSSDLDNYHYDSAATLRFAFIGKSVSVSIGDNAHGTIFAKIHYLHELQNLWYVCSFKEELNITL